MKSKQRNGQRIQGAEQGDMTKSQNERQRLGINHDKLTVANEKEVTTVNDL